MGYVRFNQVKLIICLFTLACVVLFVVQAKCDTGKKFVVQIAATKKPIQIRNFSQSHNLSDSITEFRSEFWYHYVVGNFSNYKSAADYAQFIAQNTNLKNAFVRVIHDSVTEVQPLKTTGLVLDTELNENIVQDSLLTNWNEQNHENLNEDEPGLSPDETDIKNQGNLLTRIFFKNEDPKNFRNVLISFGENHLPRNFMQPYTKIVEISLLYPVILVFIVFILFFIFNLLLVFMVLNYTIRKKNHREKYLNVYGRMYEDIIMSYMFGIFNWDKVLLKMKKIKRKTNRRILISILLNFHENLKGEINNKIPEIYVNLGLHNDSFKSAKSIFDYRKIQGIRELTYLYPKGAMGIIPGLINDRNDHVRSEAQTAYIRLNQNNPFGFFDILIRPFTRWTQITALHLIRLNQLPVPEFVKYLESKHFNIRNFSLRMITYFQQLENVSEIFKMLESKAEMTRFLTYKAINDLRLYEGKELIKNYFAGETEKNKLEIVKALRNIGIAEDFEFLENVISKESVSLKVEACRTMYFMSQESRNKILVMNEKNNSGLESYIAHVTDPRN